MPIICRKNAYAYINSITKKAMNIRYVRGYMLHTAHCMLRAACAIGGSIGVWGHRKNRERREREKKGGRYRHKKRKAKKGGGRKERGETEAAAGL